VLPSIKLLLQEVPPAWLLVICTAGNACLDMVALRARHLQCCICEIVEGDNVLLEQPDDEDELSMSVEEIQKGSKNGWREALTRSWLLAWG
jgi:hypothetical protein